MQASPILELKGISKIFGPTQALKDVDISLYEGEVVSLIGENGAGKSTLMKVIGGVHQPTTGEIKIKGKPVVIKDAKTAESLGIAFVHQELNLLDNLDIAANIFIGREDSKWGWINKRKLNEKAKPLLSSLGLNLKPSTKLDQLSNAQQQLVEIAKALSMKAKILILDEPTSSLSAYETQQLLNLIVELKKSGMTIIYISHRLSEVKEISDRVIGLRDGVVAGSLTKSEIDHNAMVSLMIGRDLKEVYPSLPKPTSEVILKVNSLSSQRWPNGRVDFELKKGEILGLYGLVGAGRSEMVQALFGVDPSPSGEIELDNKKLNRGQVKESIQSGLYLAPEDRKKSSLFLDMSIRENMTMNSLASMSRCGWIQKKQEKSICEQWLVDYGVKSKSIENPPSFLSGGNQQKVVLSKWMTQNPKVMIFDEPTRGIDIGARAEIYEAIAQLAAAGCGILMISSDMEELMGMSHRIIAMKDGDSVGELQKDEFSESALMNLILKKDEAQIEEGHKYVV